MVHTQSYALHFQHVIHNIMYQFMKFLRWVNFVCPKNPLESLKRAPSFDFKMLHELSEDVRSFYACTQIRRMYRPTALEFMRHCISVHQPCILEGMIDEWPAMQKWMSTEKFLDRAPSRVNVNFTPNGRADSVIFQSDQKLSSSGVFVEPVDISIDTKVFFNMLDYPDENDAIPYLSAQNDNLRQQMPQLLDDCAQSLPLADECFGLQPEAINLWIGDQRSVSSTHKDFFENMYCVVRGVKTFTLFPPTDVAFLPVSTYPAYTYTYSSACDDSGNLRPQKSELCLVPVDRSMGNNDNSSNEVSWIWLDPEDPQAVAKHPLFALASPLRIEVREGEVLYLPAMWLHRVSQTCLSIAVNYWYDMKFDLRYVLMQTCLRLVADKHKEEKKIDNGIM